MRLALLFSVFCMSCVGGREPTAALADKSRDEMVCKRVQSSLLELPSAADIMKSTVFRLGVYRIRQAIATQGKRFLLFLSRKTAKFTTPGTSCWRGASGGPCLLTLAFLAACSDRAGWCVCCCRVSGFGPAACGGFARCGS